MSFVELRAQPGEAPCLECEGTGEVDSPADEPWWPGMSVWDCVWCRGTGRVLRPIPVAKIVAAFTPDER